MAQGWSWPLEGLIITGTNNINKNQENRLKMDDFECRFILFTLVISLKVNFVLILKIAMHIAKSFPKNVHANEEVLSLEIRSIMCISECSYRFS